MTPYAAGDGVGVVNPLRGDCLWWHTTLNGLVQYVLRDGLRGWCTPQFGDESSPWVYVATAPFAVGPDYTTLAVDLSTCAWSDAMWAGAPGELALRCSVPREWLTINGGGQLGRTKRAAGA